ncbi:MAG: type II toxin-antitoxin system HicB family antitoxin [Oscillospiraceae bacterium]|jgi:predicted HicB family RNase H-like nuclease|nr:type II toxin-antitoxin system HicB family antitoxin [Oscillospiraceae bacterium]
MNNHLEHRGYVGSVEYSEEDDCFFGRVLGVRGLISYEGESVQELKQDFYGAVDEHIDFLERTASEGEKDTYMLHLAPSLKQSAARAAESRGLTMDSLIAESLWNSIRQQAS